MRYATASTFRTALEQRLLTLADEQGVPVLRLRKLVVFDRLMARLMIVAPDRWVLKGAVALHFRVGSQFRTTKDLDLSRQDNEEAATADFLSAQSVSLGDYFTFLIERTGKLDQAVEGAAVRYHVTAQLGGRRFEDVTVDVGFGDAAVAAPEMVRGPDLLGFAEIPPAQVPALPLEEHVAEKVHAYTRSYVGGVPSTRVKDLVDLVIISSLFSFKAARLRRALEATFTNRASHELPASLPLPPPEWRIPYRRMASEVNLDSDIVVGYERARTFLDPVLARTAPDKAQWDQVRRMWRRSETAEK
ncbi:MAG: nucleotidyl transferase AbiEii/AbiGii toxin family protein [Chloroflexi bacterium]|nr:nucleotidyl transferase AbiEii/AbiGii toxin family protein [Chloroflexota bacterium]